MKIYHKFLLYQNKWIYPYVRVALRVMLEEAQARNRVKERKARTRRLIQEGAVLEKVLPEVQAVGLDNLEEYLRRKLAGHD